MSRIGMVSTAFVLAILALFAAPQAFAAQQVITDPAGPLTSIYLNDGLGCQVDHAGDPSSEFFGGTDPGACGTFLATPAGDSATVYGPNVPGGNSTTELTPTSQSSVQGSGTAGDPYQVTTVAQVGATQLTITQVDSYVVGDESFTTQITVHNDDTSSQDALLYRAGDCYLNSGAAGYGFFDSGTGGIHCSETADNSPPGRTTGFVPVDSGSDYVEGQPASVWGDIDGSSFPDTCDCATAEDNAAGLSWPITIPAGGDVTRSLVNSFSPDTTPPETTIDSGPSGTTHDPTPTFGFSSSEPGSSFECRFDSDPFAPCSGPGDTHTPAAPLAEGSHSFEVQATDTAGNADPTPASRSFTVRTAAVTVSGSTLKVTAAAGTADNLAITQPSASVLRVTDLPAGIYTGSGLHAGPGCTLSGDETADCGAAGVSLIRVTAGDQPDKVVDSTAVKGSLDGGSGADTLIGGSSDDTLTGGPDPDVMKGMNGDDQLLARDGTDDPTINCDGGTTPGAADKAVLDPLPQDSPVSGCETKTRPQPYVALGDSLSVGVGASSQSKGFVGLLYSSYRASLGVNQLLNEGQSGATSSSLRTGGQLTRGLADINGPSDTRAVTIEVGANDGLTPECRTVERWRDCPFRANFRDILTRLKAALQNDPGAEKLTTMAYYNPPAATNPFGTRAERDRLLLGSNLKIGCADTGEQAGLNDMIFQEAGRLGIPVADTYPAFQQHGAAYMSADGIHPNDAGYAAIAQAFQNASRKCG